MNSLITAGIALAVGLAIGYFLASSAGRAKIAEATSTQSARIAGLESESIALKTQVTTLTAQLEQERQDELEETVLKTNIETMNKTIIELKRQVSQAELDRTSATTEMKTLLTAVSTDSAKLAEEAGKISGVLSNSQVRGQLGEFQLETLLQRAGLQEGRDYFTQERSSDSETTIQPDIRIEMSDGAKLFIDSKFPLADFWRATSSENESDRATFMKDHVKALTKHAKALANRGYQNDIDSPDFVIMFLPIEATLTEALLVEPTLMDDLFKLGVTVCIPSTLFPLLRTIYFTYQRQEFSEKAREIYTIAGEFIANAARLQNKINKLGKNIKTLEAAFNDVVSSAGSRMFSPARKMMSLGAPTTGSVTNVEEIHLDTREIKVAAAIEDQSSELLAIEYDPLDDLNGAPDQANESES